MTQPLFGRPRPVLTAAGVAGLITSIAGVLAWLGYANAATGLSAMTTTITAVLIGAVSMGSHVLAGMHGQSKVTPVASPQTTEGTPLVPLYSVTAPADGPAAVPGEDAASVIGAADAIYPVEPPSPVAAEPPAPSTPESGPAPALPPHHPMPGPGA